MICIHIPLALFLRFFDEIINPLWWMSTSSNHLCRSINDIPWGWIIWTVTVFLLRQAAMLHYLPETQFQPQGWHMWLSVYFWSLPYDLYPSAPVFQPVSADLSVPDEEHQVHFEAAQCLSYVRILLLPPLHLQHLLLLPMNIFHSL